MEKLGSQRARKFNPALAGFRTGKEKAARCETGGRLVGEEPYRPPPPSEPDASGRRPWAPPALKRALSRMITDRAARVLSTRRRRRCPAILVDTPTQWAPTASSSATGVTGTLAAERVDALPCTDRRGVAVHHPDYEARAIRAADQAERAVTHEMADSWRRLAESCRMLASQVARPREDDNRRAGLSWHKADEAC